MTPDSRLFYTLIAALILWAPVAMSMATGGIEIFNGGLIFLGALLLAWIGSGIISSIITSYRNTNYRVDEAKRQIEKLEARQARYANRRKEDQESEDN